MFIFLFFFLSCKVDVTTEKINKILYEYGTQLEKKFSVVIIIPTYGCSSCIEYWVEFSKQNKSKKILYLISSMTKKEVLAYYSWADINRDDFVHDYKGLISKEFELAQRKPIAIIKNDSQSELLDLTTDREKNLQIIENAINK